MKRPVKKAARPTPPAAPTPAPPTPEATYLEALTDAVVPTSQPLERLAHERFCQEYLIRPIASRAYLAAYPTCTVETAYANGIRLLGNARISERIAQLKVEQLERTTVKADEIIRQAERIATAELSDFMEWGPNGVTLKRLEDIPPELRGAVAEVSETRGKNPSLRIKLQPKQPAIDALMKVHGLYKEQESVNRVFVIEAPAPVSQEEWDKRYGPGAEWRQLPSK